MNRLTFINGQYSLTVLLAHSKYIFCDNIQDYWCLRGCFQSVLNNVPVSEFCEENNYRTKIEIDGESLSKYDELHLVNHDYSLENDYKLGAKSLLLRYCLNEIQKSSMKDEFLQLECMIGLMGDLISTDFMNVEITSLTPKLFLKLVNITFLKDELHINENDLNYEELILLQLKLIEGIADDGKRHIVLIDLPMLTEKIKKAADSMRFCMVIVICFRSLTAEFKDNIYYDHMDFEDEERLYERMMDMSNYYDFYEYKEKMTAECLKKFYK